MPITTSLGSNSGGIILGDNTNSLTITYTASAQVAADATIQITNPTNCTFSPDVVTSPVKFSSITGGSVNQPPNTAIAPIKITVNKKSGNCSFTINIKDGSNTPTQPITKTISQLDETKAHPGFSADMVSTWDGTGAQPSVDAQMLTAGTSGGGFQGVDITIWAFAYDNSGIDALDNSKGQAYIQLFDKTGNTALNLTPPDAGIGRTYYTYQTSMDNAFGLFKFVIKPWKFYQYGSIVKIYAKVGTQADDYDSYSPLIILSPAPDPNIFRPTEPDIQPRQGAYLNPPPGQIYCNVSIPKPVDDIILYGITSQDQTTDPPTESIIAYATDATTLQDDGQGHLLFPLSLNLLTPCANQNNCQQSDYNYIGYMLAKRSGVETWSDYRSIWLANPVNNIPDPNITNRPNPAPAVYKGKMQSNQLVRDTPITDWVNYQNAVESGGLVLNIPASMQNQTIEWKIYLNGTQPSDGTTVKSGTIPPGNTTIPTPVTTGGLDIPIPTTGSLGSLTDYDEDRTSNPNKGFWVEYWVSGDKANTSSKEFHCWLDTTLPH